MRIPLLVISTLIGGACAETVVDNPIGSNVTGEGMVTHFPRRAVVPSEWTAGGEALIAGRLIVAHGCLSLHTGDQIRPIVWHREAQLADDGRRVVDIRTGKSVSVGDTISLAGGVYDRPAEGRSREAYEDFPEKCVGNKIVVVGRGFHE